MTKLSDVAKRLNISTATVSRALNDKPGVSEEIRQHILQVASEMNYAPSEAARHLVTASSRTIGFMSVDHLMPLTADPFYLHVMRGAEQELSRKEYFLIVSSIYDSSISDASGLQLLREKRVDGLIIASPFFSQRFILSVKVTGVPFVLVDNALSQTMVNCVLIEDENGGYTATRHLLSHGHHAIVMLGGPDEWISSRNRSTGYRRAMQEADLPFKIFHEKETTSESGYLAMQEAFEKADNLTAVFAANDAMAFGAIKAANEKRRRIPDDLAIIGFDDVASAAHSFPTLTTMHVPKRKLGALAARRLVDILQNKEDEPPVSIMVATELVSRDSCGCKNQSESKID